MYEVLTGDAPHPEWLTADLVQATFDDNNVRARAGEFEAAIAVRRAEYARQPRITCQPKFRLWGLERSDRGLVIALGPTDYFDYLATNYDVELNATLVKYGMTVHSDPDACLSNAIGNLAIVESADGQIAALQRSEDVATFAGRVDLPGGHPEPAEVDPDLSCEIGLRDELFDAIRREVTEELGVTRTDLGDVALVGIIRSLEDGRKPEMIFHVPVGLAAAGLLQAYKTAADRKESTSLLLARPDELRRRGRALTAPSHAALDLWDAHRRGGRIG